MSEDEFKLLLCGIILFAKLGDNISTWLISPKLKLEANPVGRKLGWKFIWLTLLVCLIPWVSLEGAVAVLPILFLVAANNFSGLWFARALGEEGIVKFYTEAAARGSFRLAVASEALRAVFLGAAGGFVIFLSPERAWTGWAGFGLAATGPILMLHHVLFYRRMFRLARERKSEPPPVSGP